MKDPNIPLRNKIQVIVDRMLKLGLEGPVDEYTFGYAIALLLLTHFHTFPKYQEVFDMLGDLKEAYHAMPEKEYPFPMIYDYPMELENLPPEIMRYAYSEHSDDQPISVELPRFILVATKHVPLRKNSNLIVQEAKAETLKLQQMLVTQVHQTKL